MRKCERNRGRSSATRYHDALMSCCAISGLSGQPCPALQAEPFDQPAAPDPRQVALVDLDLGDAFHSGPQAQLGVRAEVRLDPEHVAALPGGAHRGDLGDAERIAVARQRGEDELALLPELHRGNVVLVDLQDDAIRVERRHLEHHLPALERGAERLREIAAHQDAVEGRRDLGARELLLDQRELRLRLRDLRARDAHLRALLLGHRVTVLLRVLVALRAETRALHLQVAVVEPGEHLAAADRVAGAHGGLAHIALERRGERALDLAFDARIGRNTVAPRGESEEHGERGEESRGELQSAMPGAGEPAPEILRRLHRVGAQPALLRAPQVDQRPQHAGESFEKLEGLRVETKAVRALEGQHADLALAVQQGEGGDAAGARSLRELGVRQRHDRPGLALRRVDHRLALVERLGHGIDGRAEQVRLAVEPRGVRHRLDIDRAALERCEHHPIAAQARGELGHQRRGGVTILDLLENCRDDLQDHVEAQARRLHRIGRAAQQHLEPARAPLQLAHRRLQLDLVAPRQLEPDHAAHLAVEPHRVGDLVVRPARLHQPAPFAQRALDDLRELRALAPALGPECERGERLDARLLQHHQRVAHAADGMALQLEPALAELLGARRRGEAPPRDIELAALRFSEVKARRRVAYLRVRAHGKAQPFGAGPSTLSVPKRFSYSFTTPSSRATRRLAAYGLMMMRSVSWIVTSFWPAFHAWLMPNSITISSRVLVTLHTFAYELFIAESSHLMRAPCCAPCGAAFASAASTGCSCFVAMSSPLIGRFPEWRIPHLY